MNASAETIARAFGLHRAGREYTGKCPSCGYKTGFAVADRKGSLPLVYCHAGGCSQQDLIEALRRAGLWPDERICEKPHERSRPKAKVRAAAHAPPDPDDPSPDPTQKPHWQSGAAPCQLRAARLKLISASAATRGQSRHR